MRLHIPLLLAALVVTACTKRQETKSSVNDSLAIVRPVHEAIMKYSDDSKANGKSPIFPSSLDSLVEKGYLSAEEVAQFTSLPDFKYVPPGSSDKYGPALLWWRVDDYIWTMTQDGSTQGIASPKVEQGAAANP